MFLENFVLSKTKRWRRLLASYSSHDCLEEQTRGRLHWRKDCLYPGCGFAHLILDIIISYSSKSRKSVARLGSMHLQSDWFILSWNQIAQISSQPWIRSCGFCLCSSVLDSVDAITLSPWNLESEAAKRFNVFSPNLLRISHVWPLDG